MGNARSEKVIGMIEKISEIMQSWRLDGWSVVGEESRHDIPSHADNSILDA